MTTEERIRARVAELTRERDRLDAVIAELTSLLGGQPEQSQQPGNEPARNGKPAVAGEVAVRKIRDLLAEEGPLRAGEIVVRTGLSQPTVTLATKSPWFRKQTENRLSPWELTDEGRAAG